MLPNYKRPTLIPASRFPHKFISEVTDAKRRVVICTMTMAAGHSLDDICQALLLALDRGISVTIFYDVYSELSFHHPGRQLKLLADAGADIQRQGSIGINPFKGRYHQKIYVVDDVVFSFGGVNMKEKNFNAIDYIVGWKNKALADVMVKHLIDDKTRQNQQVTLDKHNTVLIDAGQPGQSIIEEKAIELALLSRTAVVISRMAPSAGLVRALSNTHSSRYFYNRLKTAGWATRVSLLIDNHKLGLVNEYHGNSYLHAKCIIFEMMDGKQCVLTGSHNFNQRGVAYGTHEVALLSYDAQFYEQCQSFVSTYVVGTN